MPTTEENIELIETLKNPEKYYRVSLVGHGSDIAYTEVSKDAYEYWSGNERGLVDYYVDPVPDRDHLPTGTDFLWNKELEKHELWFSNSNLLDTVWGLSVKSPAYITVEQLPDWDYISEPLRVLKDQERIDIFDYDVEWIDPKKRRAPYVVEFNSHEKGTFFDIHLTLLQTFNIKKLQLVMDRAFDGEQFIVGLKYNDEDVSVDFGGDTVGKGYSAQMINYRN